MATPHFLKPILHESPDAYVLRNGRHGRLLASAIEAAFDSATRRRGLLGRDGLDDGAALIIAPCQAIHTFGMRFAIDVVFTNKNGLVLKCCPAVKPGRLAGCLTAFAVIELPAGAIERSETRVNDAIECVPISQLKSEPSGTLV
jgi:uncharacterized membrane protein (UPF0127 family)